MTVVVHSLGAVATLVARIGLRDRRGQGTTVRRIQRHAVREEPRTTHAADELCLGNAVDNVEADASIGPVSGRHRGLITGVASTWQADSERRPL
jgi:hypothetical protein